MEKYYKKLDKFYLTIYTVWKSNRSFFILVISGFFIFIAGYFLCLYPLINHKKTICDQIIKLKKKLQVKQEIVASDKVYQKKLALLKQQFFLDLDESEEYKSKVLLALLSGQMLPEYLVVNYLKAYASKNSAFFMSPCGIG